MKYLLIFILLFSFTLPAQAAISLVGTPASSGSGGNPGPTSLTTSFTTNAAADILIAAITMAQGGSNSKTVSTVTYAATALTKVTGAYAARLNAGTSEFSDLWFKASPATGANNLVTTPSAAVNSLIHGVAGFSGTDGTFGSAASSTGTANPGTKAVTSVANQVVVGVAGLENQTAANVSSNNVQLWEQLEQAQEQQIGNMAYSTSTSPTMSWGNTGGNGWTISAAVLTPSGGAAAPTTQVLINAPIIITGPMIFQ